MNIKHILLTGWVAGMALPAVANPITLLGSASPGVVIPDDDLNGVASTIELSAPASEITSVTLTLDIAGYPFPSDAYNGDYYAYLQFSSGLMVLLNNIDAPLTYGSPGSGLNVTLSDGNPNIGSAPFTAGLPLTGTYAPQGGGASTGSSLGNTFAGLNPNGAWTFFIADESPGGVGELVDWSLTVTANTVAVPDGGASLGLLVLGLSSLAFWSLRQRRPSLPIAGS